VRAITLSLL
jgi:hypothetical protein